MLSIKRELLDRASNKDHAVVFIGDDIKVTVLGYDGSSVRLGIEAPQDIAIWRAELHRKIEEQVESISGATKEKRFRPPTPDEVDLYIVKQGFSGFTGERFCSFYESKEWMIGRNKMKNWRAAVRTWGLGKTWTTKGRNGR